jgi:hypothetical protein
VTTKVTSLLVSLVLIGGLASTAGAELFTSHVTDSEMLLLMPEDELSFTAEGRIGGVSTFELDLGRTTAVPAQTAEYGWQSGVPEPFTVAYDAGTNTASFSLGGVVLSYQPDRYFNEIFVRTRAVDDGCAATVSDIVLEGEAVADLSQATGPEGRTCSGSAAASSTMASSSARSPCSSGSTPHPLSRVLPFR